MAEKSKKIEKDFVLSDSSVNCYGFRLLTSGYQLASYEKNPIGYYMHNRDGGVLVKWEDLRIEGDQVLGKPVINLSNARGQQTVDEIESGFLNAASMGEFVVLEYSLDPALMLEGQTGPTITKWYNGENSLVDIPGNGNALCKLFNQKGNEIKLADLMAGIDDTQKNNTNTMHEIKLSLPDLVAIKELGLTVADGAGLIAQIKELKLKHDNAVLANTTLTTEKAALETKLAGLSKQEVTDMLKAALDGKQITVELSKQFETDYATNPTGLKTILANLKGYTSVVEQIANKGGDLPALFKDKTWDELHQADLLPKLKKEHFDYYKVLYEGKYQTVYEPKA